MSLMFNFKSTLTNFSKIPLKNSSLNFHRFILNHRFHNQFCNNFIKPSSNRLLSQNLPVSRDKLMNFYKAMNSDDSVIKCWWVFTLILRNQSKFTCASKLNKSETSKRWIKNNNLCLSSTCSTFSTQIPTIPIRSKKVFFN